MKKLLSILVLSLFCTMGIAQTVTLTFTGRDSNNQFVPLDRVVITDATQGWQDSISYPDTVYVLQTVGIDDHGDNLSFGISQNAPNPFEGTTDFLLQMPVAGKAYIELNDLNGRRIATYNNELPAGRHTLRVQLTIPQSYVLNARSGNERASIKMINTGNAGLNRILYLGEGSFSPLTVQLKCGKGQSNLPFNLGDNMTYIGYAVVNGVGYQSDPISQPQSESESFVLNFNPPGNIQNDGKPCPGAATLTDRDGNVYNTVLIGKQCWMKENLRTTKYADNTPVVLNSETSYDDPHRYCPGDDSSKVNTYGYLYNWAAVTHTDSSGVQGLCPASWHVPSDSEFSQLADYVGSVTQYICDDIYVNIGKALASTSEWENSTNNCAVGNDLSSNNATGFSALPVGNYYIKGYENAGQYAYFWTSTVYDSGNAYDRFLYSKLAKLNSGMSNKREGYSVRCIKDTISDTTVTADIPTVVTSPVSHITETTATCGGEVTDDGGAAITERGVCYATSSNPTVSGYKVTATGTTGAFTCDLTGLQAGTSYYVRAYATNSEGTAYGNEMTFKTEESIIYGTPCPDMPTVTDHEGNVYNTVQIGTQCWTKENMRCKTSPSTGLNIVETAPTTYSYTGKKAYFANNDVSTSDVYGLLYNWLAAVDTFNTKFGETSTNDDYSNAVDIILPDQRRGICPEGWHVPSNAEWTRLTDYVSSQTDYICNDQNVCIGKSLASTEGWTNSLNDCAVGNTQGENNATGFTAYPAGDFNGVFEALGYMTYFWSATPTETYYANFRALSYSYAYVDAGNDIISSAYSVRCVKDTIPIMAPEVTTAAVSEATKMTAACGGNVTSDGGAAITERGVCYSTNPNPTIEDIKVPVKGTTGIFSCYLMGLTAKTTYYVRAYAANSKGTTYGDVVKFTTTAGFSCGSTVTDHEGNAYGTVQIGNQCWMTRNMRCETSPSTGTRLVQNPANSYSFSGKVAYYYKDNTINADDGYGLLYNWCAAVDTFDIVHGETSMSEASSFVPYVVFEGYRRGICPKGWHVPSDVEWTQLTNYAGKYYACNNNKTYIAKALASSRDWKQYTDATAVCIPGADQINNNATDFSALPAGRYYGNYRYYDRTNAAYFWSSTQKDLHEYAHARNIKYRYATVQDESSNSKAYGYSVRCLCDETENTVTATLPTVTTSPVSEVTSTTANLAGNVSDDGDAAVVMRGLCWSTTPNPTVYDSHTTNGLDTGSIISKITNLVPNTMYYVRAFAMNSVGIAYGNQEQFTTSEGFLCGMATVTDYDGNTYNTIPIGKQCWLKENLKTTHYSDGTPISLGSEDSFSEAYRYYPGNDSNNVNLYGYYYNWTATMNHADSSNLNPSGVQGVCPTGWHVPSDAEWTQLSDYVSSMDQYCCHDNNKYIAKALASSYGWKEAYGACTVGYLPCDNDATGFSALPAGTYGTNNIGSETSFWTTTEMVNRFDTWCCYRNLSSLLAYLDVNKTNSANGYSVRCLKD